jgi:hypothetical protein
LQGKKISKKLWIKKSAHLTSHISFYHKNEEEKKVKDEDDEYYEY